MDAKRLALAGGVLWGLALFLMTLVGCLTSYGGLFFALIVDVYPGYSVSFFGSFVALVYGFLDGFIGFYALAWLYNFFE